MEGQVSKAASIMVLKAALVVDQDKDRDKGNIITDQVLVAQNMVGVMRVGLVARDVSMVVDVEGLGGMKGVVSMALVALAERDVSMVVEVEGLVDMKGVVTMAVVVDAGSSNYD